MQRKRAYKRMIAFVVVMVILVALVMIIFPPSKGEMPQFQDDNGEILSDSISEKCYLEIDGEKLGMILLAKDKNKPVLLVCGGGPGIPESFYQLFNAVLWQKYRTSYFRRTAILT